MDPVGDRVRHLGLALAMATLATIAQMNHAPNAADALAHLQVLAMKTLEMTCIPRVRSLEVPLRALTTGALVVTAVARAVADETILMK